MTISRRRVVIAAVFALALGNLAQAQEVPKLRFYLVPKIGTGVKGDGFRPKYIADMGLSGWSGMDFGKEPSFLVGADVTDAQHTTIAANLDVVAIPLSLDDTINAVALTTIQSKLEGLKIPGNHFTTANTYRQVVRIVGCVFQLLQRFDGLRQKTFFDSGITLATTFGQLTASQQTDLQTAMQQLGADTSAITSATTVRQILRGLATSLPAFGIQGETF